MTGPEFSSLAARDAAAHGQLEAWLYHYLQAGEWANPGLLSGLQLQPRWWLGPLEVELDRLIRCCGPEPWMEYRVPEDGWERHIARMAERLAAPTEMPPLIVVYNQGRLSIRDGNHRHEAMRRSGWKSCWVVIWHNSLEDYEAHLRQRAVPPDVGTTN